MIRVSTNFDLKSNIPLDDRFSFETENEMLKIEPLDIYYGAITHVKKSNKTYMYVATNFDSDSNPTEGKWVQIFENAKPIVTAESVKYETGKESDGTPIYGKNTQQVLDSLQNDFKNSIAGNKWKEPVNSVSNLSSLTPVQGEVRYVIGTGIYMFNGSNWISVVDTIPLANTTKSGLMSADDKVKVDKINISSTASNKYFGEDGNYHDVTSLDVVTTSANGIMSSADKTKLDALPSLPLTSATGSKFLNDLGQFTTVSAVLNASDQAKLDKIITSGDGSLVLSNNGNYVALPTLVTQTKDGLMSANDKKKLDSYGSLPAGATGSKFLNDLGQFTAVTATLNSSDQAKLDKIITTGDGSLVLSNNGNYVALPGLVTQVKDGLMSSTDKTKLDGILIDKTSGSTAKFLNEQGNFTDFVVDAKNVNYNPPAGSRLTATTVQGAFDEVLNKVSNIDDSAATTSTTSTYSISKINDLLRSKSNTGHNHSVTDITDLTANYYTQAQVDSKIKNAANAMIWQPPVNEIADLATTYPNPENGWTVIVQNENSFYRYNGTTWVNFGTMQFNSLVTSSENGLMSSADKIKLDKIDENAPRIYYSSTEPPRVNGNIWVVD